MLLWGKVWALCLRESEEVMEAKGWGGKRAEPTNGDGQSRHSSPKLPCHWTFSSRSLDHLVIDIIVAGIKTTTRAEMRELDRVEECGLADMLAMTPGSATHSLCGHGRFLGLSFLILEIEIIISL